MKMFSQFFLIVGRPGYLLNLVIFLLLLGGCLNGSLFDSDNTVKEKDAVSKSETIETVALDPQLVSQYQFLYQASPRAKKSIIDGFSRADDPMLKAGLLQNQERFLQFLSQSAVETFGFRTLEENMNYSADRLVEVFPRHVTPEEASKISYKPKEIANTVYGGRSSLGNIPGTDDGWNFRGSGYIQLTGRYNFEKMSKIMNLDIVSKPELVRQPQVGLDSAIAFWNHNNISTIADSGSIRAVRKKVNGGTNGLPEAKFWYAQIKKYLPKGPELETDDSIDEELNQAAADILGQLGLLQNPGLESTFSSGAYARALKEFQVSRGLKPTGVIDEDTLYEITDPFQRYSGE